MWMRLSHDTEIRYLRGTEQLEETFQIPADKWDLRFLELALLVRTWSKDPSTQHATVIVRPDRTICSVGYNGFPRSMPDREEYLQDRDEKLRRVVHGEMNAILSAHEPVRGYTAYTVSGVGCDRCVVHLIQAGITKCVFLDGDEDYWSRWGEAAEKSLRYLEECGVSWRIVNFETGKVMRCWQP